MSRRELALWANAVFAARYAAAGLRDLLRGTEVSYSHLANFGIFQLLAWGAIFLLLLRRSAPPSRASRLDFAVAALCAGTVLLQDDNAGWVGMSLLACYLIVTAPNLRPAATVMAALVTQLFWGRVLFEAIAFRIETFDARMAAGLLTLMHRPVLLQDNILTTGSAQIAIYEACTSFHNISVAMLCWVTVTKLVRPNWRPADFAIAGALILITVAMNSLRLFLMANASPDLFDFWHTGIGAGAINAGLSLLVMAIAVMAARPAWSTA